MGSKGSFDFCAKDSSMKSPPAPESIKALVSTVRSLQVIDTGIRMDCLDTSATTTGETMTSGRRDVDAADRFNPLSEHDDLLLVLIRESLEYCADAVDRAVLVGRRRGRRELR